MSKAIPVDGTKCVLNNVTSFVNEKKNKNKKNVGFAVQVYWKALQVKLKKVQSICSTHMLPNILNSLCKGRDGSAGHMFGQGGNPFQEVNCKDIFDSCQATWPETTPNDVLDFVFSITTEAPRFYAFYVLLLYHKATYMNKTRKVFNYGLESSLF